MPSGRTPSGRTASGFMSDHSRSDRSRGCTRARTGQTRPIEVISRRRLLRYAALALPAAVVLQACGGGGDDRASGSAPRRRATPACGSSPVTPEQTEGPFFSTGSPERTVAPATGCRAAAPAHRHGPVAPTVAPCRAPSSTSGTRTTPASTTTTGYRLPRPPVHRRRRRLPARDDRPGVVHGPHAPHPREGAGAEPTRAARRSCTSRANGRTRPTRSSTPSC